MVPGPTDGHQNFSANPRAVSGRGATMRIKEQLVKLFSGRTEKLQAMNEELERALEQCERAKTLSSQRVEELQEQVLTLREQEKAHEEQNRDVTIAATQSSEAYLKLEAEFVDAKARSLDQILKQS
jgi:hypothetical protein